MSKITVPDATLLSLEVDRHSSTPLHRQVCDGLRNAILAERIGPGARVPSTRSLAQELGVSRNIVLIAYDQLRSEGYLDAAAGGGTRVRRFFPTGLADRVRGALRGRSANPSRADANPTRRYRELGSAFDTPFVRPPARAFAPGVPALDSFPLETWRRLMSRCARDLGRGLLTQTDPEGYPPLREAIANHIRISRGVDCDPDQVVITAGAQQAFALCSTVLLQRGDRVWFEEPGYSGALEAFRYAGVASDPVRVDEGGIVVAEGLSSYPSAALAYVTPTHQFPVGVPMALERRLELLDWAASEGAWILEDDYDSEFRFQGAPLPALHGLDENERVIYVGTFSKSVFPSLRLGFAVLPPDLAGAFARARAFLDNHSPVLEQATLASFISGGHFARHVRKMRTLYRWRRDLLLELLADRFGTAVETPHSDTGLHVTVLIPEGVDDRVVSEKAAANGVLALPLSGFAQRRIERGGLVLGFAGITEDQITSGVEVLGRSGIDD